MFRLKATKKSQELHPVMQWCDLQTEAFELRQAIQNEDIDNIKEELFDVIQWCANIAQWYDIDLNEALKIHKSKLIERGHDFVL